MATPLAVVAIQGEQFDATATTRVDKLEVTSSDDDAVAVSAGGIEVNRATFTNGPAGINAGKHLEWMEEYISGAAPTNGAQFGWHSTDVVGAVLTITGTTTRPGIVNASTSTSSTSRFVDATRPDIFDLASYTTVIVEWVGGFPALSTSAEEFEFLAGAIDERASINQTDGCYFSYDRGSVATNPTTGDTTMPTGDIWKIWCASNGTRTGYALDGGPTEDGFTSVNSPVAVLTLPDTNIYHLKIVIESTALARFFINDTEVGRITTNIPSGSSQLTGAGNLFIKSNGTTARNMQADWWKLTLELTVARSP